MVQLVKPFFVLPFDGGVYIDEIGILRGVPNEYKAWNQIAAGFESFLFW